jgi:hypothetical protein
MQKVLTPRNYEIYECPRCHQCHCDTCATGEEVEFNTLSTEEINWEGEKVCPWCYNQLVEAFENINKKEGG